MSIFRNQRGQATVELALVIPLVIIVLACCVQVSGVLLDQVAITQLAREVARSAAVAPVSGASSQITDSLRPDRLDTSRLQIHAHPGDQVVTVVVDYQSQVKAPFLNLTLFCPELHAHIAMWVEHSE